MGPLEVLDGDPHRLTGLPDRWTSGEPTQPDLGSLQVTEDADGSAGHVRRRPNALVSGLVVDVVSMAEIQPGYVHAGFYQCPD